ncbi:putative protein [alpha proteobacterium Q-1]|nr:putative protein [alpha proteobacterium Q-1]
MADKNDIFVAYAFCVGDIFMEIGPDQCITRLEGALDWVGIAKGASAIGQPMSAFLSAHDAEVMQSAFMLLENTPRIGPVRVAFGATEATRRRLGLFMSRLSSHEKNTHIVAMSLNRLDGGEQSQKQPILDKDNFLDHLPRLLEEHGKNSNTDLLVSLLQLSKDADADERKKFTQTLATLSVGGQSAAELSDGRFAVVHEANDERSAQTLMDTLKSTTGQAFDSATLDAESMGSGADAAKALVYSIRQFSDSGEDFDLENLTRNYSKNMEETRKRIQSLRALIKDRRFNIAYQPIVAITTKALHHVEALVRFDMRGGSPYEMISFAEQVGMIDEFDQIMLETVIKNLRRLVARGANPSIAVNLSARSLTTPSFISRLKETLLAHRGLRNHLIIEVTESAQVSDLGPLGQSIAMIREAGFAVCLDDFGAGHSGFQYLRQLKVDVVKIDGSYIKDAENDAESRAFLRAMASLCKDLKIKMVGEWIETPAQAELLKSVGVELGQGFLFGRPMMTLPKEMQKTPTPP